ncbi:MAG TPA: aldose epimerase family protein [Flavisolibacter sp.]|jgi:aldose 1-epimerase|nr:aldose epimerase family protein [Flavisolibacter sp.]
MKSLEATYPKTQPIEEMHWGEVEGRAISLYKLANSNGSKLFVTNYGATIQSLYVRDKSGKLEDVVLGYDTLEEYVNDSYYFGCVVGRYANRIAGGTVKLYDKEYKLHTREGGYHLHGGSVGFNKKVWSAETVERETACGIRLSYLSIDGEEGFPGNVRTTVTYWLTELNQVMVEYTATTDQTTLINLTQHSYFNLAGHYAGTILDHKLQIHSPWYLPVNSMQVPKGEIADVAGTPFDFQKPKNIGVDIEQTNPQLYLSGGYDHSWVLEQQHTPIAKHAATVTDAVSGRVLDVYTTEPAVHFYSANFIEEGTKGKKGAVYNRRTSFCLETQHFPDAPNHSHFPSTVLEAGEEFYSKTVFEFSVVL